MMLSRVRFDLTVMDATSWLAFGYNAEDSVRRISTRNVDRLGGPDRQTRPREQSAQRFYRVKIYVLVPMFLLGKGISTIASVHH